MERLFGVLLLASAVACDGGASSGETDGGSDSGGEASGSDPSAGDDTAGDPTGAETATSTSGGTSAGSTSGDATTADAGDTTGSGLPEGSGCCEAHAGASCDEQTVAECVCADQPECCVFDWLESCAEAAQSQCEATCESDDSGGSSDSGTQSMACEDTVFIELGAADASVSGNWGLTTSQVGEGEILVLDLQSGADGEVRWDIDIPCDDTFYIWVRLFDQGQADSFFATLDGEPSPPAIFEGGFAGPGQGWNWRDLNWRDPDDPGTFVADPWAPEWEAGSHALALTYRESFAVARIEVTNDPEYAP